MFNTIYNELFCILRKFFFLFHVTNFENVSLQKLTKVTMSKLATLSMNELALENFLLFKSNFLKKIESFIKFKNLSVQLY